MSSDPVEKSESVTTAPDEERRDPAGEAGEPEAGPVAESEVIDEPPEQTPGEAARAGGSEEEALEAALARADLEGEEAGEATKRAGEPEGPEAPGAQPVQEGRGDPDPGEKDSPVCAASHIPEGARISRTVTPAAGERASKVAVIRSVASALQRMMALGLLAVIGSAMLNSAIAIRLIVPMSQGRLGALGGEGLVASLLGGLMTQFGLLLVLPALAWGMGWLIEDRPFRLAFGAAIFAELWHSAVMILTSGYEAFVQEPRYLISRLVFVAVAGLLAGLAYGHARKMAARTDMPQAGSPK